MRPAGLCSYRAAAAAGFDARPRAIAAIELPPRRQNERRPPLVTWPNYDLKRNAAMGPRKRALTTAEARAAIGSYMACASHVDTQLGRMLATLRSLGLEATTAVVVHSDHGFSLGRHGRWSKYSLYEEAVRVPLVISVPGLRVGGQVDQIVEGVDILPTLLDLWRVRRGVVESDGTEEPKSTFLLRDRAVPLDGHSLLPFLQPHQDSSLSSSDGDGVSLVDGSLRAEDAAPSWPKWYARSELHEVFRRNTLEGPLAGASEDGRQFRGAQLSIRTTRFAYTAFLKLDPQNQSSATSTLGRGHNGSAFLRSATYRLVDETLYHTEGDPGEANNIAYDRAYSEQRARMRDLCIQEWSVRLRGPRDETRPKRNAYLKQSSHV